jgi:septal ring factor EnvC (AmiA/AmiB activator)
VINNPEVKALYDSWGKRLARVNDLIRELRKNREATREDLSALKKHRKKINNYRNQLENDRNLVLYDPGVVLAYQLAFRSYEMP